MTLPLSLSLSQFLAVLGTQLIGTLTALQGNIGLLVKCLSRTVDQPVQNICHADRIGGLF